MALHLFNTQDGIQLGKNRVSIVRYSCEPYGVLGPTALDVTSLIIGSLWIDSNSGKLYQKVTNTNNSILDWVVFSSNPVKEFRTTCDYIVDFSGDQSTFDTWALTSPSDRNTFLNITDGIIYIGNSTTTPTVALGLGDLLDLRIASKDSPVIYAGNGVGNYTQADIDGLLSVDDKFFTNSEELTNKCALYRYNGSLNEKVADANWEFANGIYLTDVFNYNTFQEYYPMPLDSIETAISKLTTLIEYLRKTTNSSINSSSATSVVTFQVSNQAGTRHRLSFDIEIYKVGVDNQHWSCQADILALKTSTDVIQFDSDCSHIFNLNLDCEPRISFEVYNTHNIRLMVQLVGYTSGTYMVYIHRRNIGGSYIA